VLIEEFAMGIGQPPRKKQDRPAVDNVVSLRQPDDEFFDVLSPLLEETAPLKDNESPRRETHNVLWLSKENARLRALAVGLSNLLGDLPVRAWEDAARSRREA
jgi:hypothetical protein